jgi:hypothetical protein
MTSFIMQGDRPDRPSCRRDRHRRRCRLANGLIITKLRVNPFIATLGVALILRGVLFSAFDNFAGSVPPDFQFIAYGSIGPIPISILLLTVAFALAWYVLRTTRFGHHLYAVGGSEEVARPWASGRTATIGATCRSSSAVARPSWSADPGGPTAGRHRRGLRPESTSRRSTDRLPAGGGGHGDLAGS